MTTLISWLGVDSRGPSSVYLASDSRISWPGGARWDMGTKIFSAAQKPELFGYCGDVIFPTQVLPKVCEQIDRLSQFSIDALFSQKVDWVLAAINECISEYPSYLLEKFEILYISRVREGREATFHAALITSFPDVSLNAEFLELPIESGLIERIGSGRASVKNWYSKWQNSDAQRTSRAVFGAFCDSLDSKADPRSGGAPQLIGLYRKGPPRLFGIIWKNERYRLGMRHSEGDVMDDVEWRNSNFERCDPKSMMVLEGAQKQPRPNNVGVS